MPSERLSALDASFLAVEGPSTPMHVGWVTVFDPPENGPRPGFDEVFEHIAGRLRGAPRYRQRLAAVPLGVHEPVWVDDAGFDASAHLLHAEGEDLTALVDGILSTHLARDRPLWELWIADSLPDGSLALVGKMHHCMVDGMAVADLGERLLDGKPDASDGASQAAGWSPAPVPSPGERLARGLVDRAADGAALALAPLRLATSPSRLRGLPGAVDRGARTMAHTLLPPAPSSFLNRAGSAERHHVRLARSVDDLRVLRRRFDVTPNDVVLAVCAGALRRFAGRRGEAPQPLKVMVPADVRSDADSAGSGNRISFLFIELPCDEPDPVKRLKHINRVTAQRERDGEAEELDAVLRAVARTPGPVQWALAQAFAHPRLFNLTISTMPGPAVPRYLRGCRLREAHSAVPLTGGHALSIGVVTVAGRVCFAIYADALGLPDADLLGADLDHSLDELLGA
ncbi:MAG: wax ester/triacylglycerol synthase family O-acyltransferase [Actinomycetota bacterium]|nr:wax ester/triacylglycerol synthase family O-acyltransferase [Actinomycetota bacterium]